TRFPWAQEDERDWRHRKPCRDRSKSGSSVWRSLYSLGRREEWHVACCLNAPWAVGHDTPPLVGANPDQPRKNRGGSGDAPGWFGKQYSAETAVPGAFLILIVAQFSP